MGVHRSDALLRQSEACAADLSLRLEQLREQLEEAQAAALAAARESHESESRAALQQQRDAAEEDM